MTIQFFARTSCMTSIIALGTALASPTSAQSRSKTAAGPDADQSHDIIVTARKREESIQNVPIAITAIKQEDLTTRQVTGGPDLVTQVPNMTFTKTNFTGYSIQIRGIGTQAISATTDAAVAVAFNNTPFIRNRFFEQEFYDLDRVEVLRGPQGTLYGRNATGGVVNLLSHKPDFVPEAKLSFDYGSYNQRRGEGMINIPLVDDKLALRVAGAFTKRDGYVTNSITDSAIDGRDLWSTRTSLRFKPADGVDFNLVWEHFDESDDRLRSGKQLCKTDEVTSVAGFPTTHFQTLPGGGQQLLFAGVQGTFSQGCKPASLYSPDSFQTPNGISLPYYLPLSAIFLPAALDDPYVSRTQSTDLRVIESTVEPIYKARSNIFEGQLNVDLSDHLRLTSETAYNTDSVFSEEDFNRFNTAPGAWRNSGDRPGVLTPGPNGGGIFCDPQIGCTDRLVGIDLSTAKSTQFSQELRLASSNDGPFNFSVGANFLRYKTEDKYYVFFNSLSLIAANIYGDTPGISNPIPPYSVGSTNSDCLPSGLIPPDPSVIQKVVGCIYIDPNPIGSLNDMGHNYFLSRNPYRLTSYAAFGEAYYDITSNLKLSAGLRLTYDKKEAPLIPSWILAAGSAGYPTIDTVTQTWTEPTGKLSLDWKPDLAFTNSTLLYASYARGYKAGGANPPPAGPTGYALMPESALAQAAVAQSATHPRTFAPEFVNAFEIGAKNTLFNGALTVNLAGFYYDYHGYQISQIVDRSATNLNFDATIWGAELETDWHPTRNLQLGLKLGYEHTRLADGSRAIDLADRTAGNPDWVVVRPFPTFPSNCILPASLFVGVDGAGTPQLVNIGGKGGGSPGPCEIAYGLGYDPITALPYVPDPTVADGFLGSLDFHPGYAGWDPSTAPNHGEGFYKDISGKELPNAPHVTATVTADYSIPLGSRWLATLHGDFYYQTKAWTRIFNTPDYDRIKAYSNVNLALILTNDDAGWNVMAYVKNVFDRTAITGAFLNSDDTGLTTNVFLTEPRRYGVRLTKRFDGLPFGFGGSNGAPHKPGTPYPVTVEVASQIQRQQGRVEAFRPGFASSFDPAIDAFMPAQRNTTGWHDGTDIKVTVQPSGTPWKVSGAVRFGRVAESRQDRAARSQRVCAYTGPAAAYCAPDFQGGYYYDLLDHQFTNFSDVAAVDVEKHEIVDFMVSRDVGFGSRDRTRMSLGLGLRYAHFSSAFTLDIDGVPDNLPPEGFFVSGAIPHYHRYLANVSTNASFKGVGPVAQWEGSQKLIGGDDWGRFDLKWSASGGVLFGRQHAAASDDEVTNEYDPNSNTINYLLYTLPVLSSSTDSTSIRQSRHATVPTLGGSVDLNYSLGRISIGGGYRWERYFKAIDGIYGDGKRYDRTIQGPYLKLSVGFGN